MHNLALIYNKHDSIGLRETKAELRKANNLKTKNMGKIKVLSIMFSAVIFGLFALVTEINAQVETKADTQNIDQKSSFQSTKSEMTFSYFSSANSFYDNDELIGRDVQFKINGVTMNVGLIKLTKGTWEFNTGFAKGKLFENKVELSCPNSILNDSRFTYKADKIEKSEGKILLKGNARITYSDNNLIETDEIVIIII